MFTCRAKQFTHIHNGWPIHLEGFYSSSSRSCQPDNARIIFVPAKVILPFLLSRIVQRNHFPIDRVGGFHFVVFVPIATATSQRQILKSRNTAATARDDMLKHKRLCGIVHPTLAILTTFLRSVNNYALFFNRNVTSRHEPEDGEYLTGSLTHRGIDCATEPTQSNIVPVQHLPVQFDQSVAEVPGILQA